MKQLVNLWERAIGCVGGLNSCYLATREITVLCFREVGAQHFLEFVGDLMLEDWPF